VSYEIVVGRKSADFLNGLDDKNRRIVRSRLATLKDDPFPGKGGDKELIKSPKGRPDDKVYRLHVSRSFTAFYQIKEKTVYITEVLTIEPAHKKYGIL
jgi:mRNA-degrading endonuclease RelE of RelBE toxin-antitoxin system